MRSGFKGNYQNRKALKMHKQENQDSPQNVQVLKADQPQRR